MGRVGLVQVYTGTGKGKTTAAFGLAMRASGRGLRVFILQFMKGAGEPSGEVLAAGKLEGVQVHRFGGNLISGGRATKAEIAADVARGLAFAREAMSKKTAEDRCDVLILDEINVALHLGLADQAAVIDLVGAKPSEMELVVTGRHAPRELMELADLVTEFKEIKHPHSQGQKARRGIDF